MSGGVPIAGRPVIHPGFREVVVTASVLRLFIYRHRTIYAARFTPVCIYLCEAVCYLQSNLSTYVSVLMGGIFLTTNDFHTFLLR